MNKLKLEEQVDLAYNYAKASHGMQLRRGSALYIDHLQRVYNNVFKKYINDSSISDDSFSQMRIAAYLHDVLEDTDATEEQLRKIFDDVAIDIVVLLTKKKGQSYTEYLNSILQNDLARRVKILDMIDNISDTPTPRQVEKYAKGLQILIQPELH